MQELSNRELIERHGAPGMVGLSGGSAFIDRAIRRLQRPLLPEGGRSLWSHAFLILDRRADGQLWVLESDLDLRRKQVRFGVQENRCDKYWDEALYPNLALLDFELTEAQVRSVLTAALDLLARRSRYSVRELLGTLASLHRPPLRAQENLLAREGAIYCSALVQHCYAQVGLRFAEGVVDKNLTPQDLASTQVPHRRYEAIRDRAGRARP